MAQEFTLDLLGSVILEMRADLRQVNAELREVKHRLTTIEQRLDQHHEEMTVVTGIAIRASGERMVWNRLRDELRHVNERLDRLEGKP